MAERRRKDARTDQYESAAFRQWVERVAANARRLRDLQGWSQEDAADVCGLSRRHYQSVEAASLNLTVTTLARLSSGFGVDPIELILSTPTVRTRRPGRPSRKT